ncbi:MAG: hypothetical protein IKB70_06190 [Bacilli bacterium]|nr:hypothetical protein [Bacilli bacterium]
MNKIKEKKYFVISHTHWDREWYLPFENFRLKLVHLIDRLLKILEKNKNYIFHLDAQCVVLEDYLELRPYNKQILCDYIKSGNIIIGPWYLQSDLYYSGGEATIRNLNYGIEIANQYGKCSNIGYCADQFGIISQLPQILSNYGIDTFIFGRGYTLARKDENGEKYEEPHKCEFKWRGADGTELLSVHMLKWYNNAQHISTEIDKAEALVYDNYKEFEGCNFSDAILLMNGVDHLEAQPDIIEAIDNLQKAGYNIKQYTFAQYVDYIKDYFEKNNVTLPVVEGALNKGFDLNMLKGCRASRPYLKTSNVQAEDLLENKIEPLYSYLEQVGMKGVYPKGELNHLWKSLLKMQTHDCICGCSVNAVHSHMEDRFESINELGKDVLLRGMKLLSHHIDSKYKNDGNYLITVFNPTEKEFSGVVTETLKIPTSEKIQSFEIFDAVGNSIDFAVVDNKINVIDIVSELNLPGMLEVNEITVQFYVEEVQPYGVTAYSVVPCNKVDKNDSDFNNDFVDFEITNDSFVLVDKVTNKKYINPFYIEDEADKGDAYVFYPSPCDKKVVAYPNSCSLVFENRFKKTALLKFEYDYPEEFDFENNKCKQSFKRQSCNLYLSLLKDSKMIEINLEFDNKCKDHRVRFCIDCGFNNEGLMTDSPFDYIINKKYDCGEVSDSFTHCNSTFAYSENENVQALFCTEGLYEVENFEGKIAFTIVRSTGRISYDYNFIGDNFKCSENQTLRLIKHRIGMSFGALSPSECFITAKQFRVGCLTIADSYDVRKYAGGRFAVQSTPYSEFYYLEDEYNNVSTNGKELFKLSGKDVVVSAVKCDGEGNLVVRLLNFSEEDSIATIEFDGKIAISNMIEDTIAEIERNKKVINLKKKQIVTLKLIRG